MSKVILICGKICCGKTTYAEKLRTENNAVSCVEMKQKYLIIKSISY